MLKAKKNPCFSLVTSCGLLWLYMGSWDTLGWKTGISTFLDFFEHFSIIFWPKIIKKRLIFELVIYNILDFLRFWPKLCPYTSAIGFLSVSWTSPRPNSTFLIFCKFSSTFPDFRCILRSIFVLILARKPSQTALQQLYSSRNKHKNRLKMHLKYAKVLENLQKIRNVEFGLGDD